MRKLEAVVKEIVDELGYLQRRELRMRDTNGEPPKLLLPLFPSIFPRRRAQRTLCCDEACQREADRL
jgi:hypothetical protein